MTSSAPKAIDHPQRRMVNYPEKKQLFTRSHEVREEKQMDRQNT
jgi:hypothetical protein